MCFVKQCIILVLLLAVLPCYTCQKSVDERINESVLFLPPAHKENRLGEFSIAYNNNKKLFERFLQLKALANWHDSIPQGRIGCLAISCWKELLSVMSMYVNKNDQNDVVVQCAPAIMHHYKKEREKEKNKNEESERLIAVEQEEFYTRAVIDFLIPLEHLYPDNVIADPVDQSTMEIPKKRKKNTSDVRCVPQKNKRKKRKNQQPIAN